MGHNEPKSQGLSLQVRQGSCQYLTRKGFWSQVSSRTDKVLNPAGQSLRQLMPSTAWSSMLLCRAQLSQQWSGACLNYILKVVYSTLLGLLISVLAPLMISGEFPPGVYLWVVLVCRHGCSGHMCRYLRCVSLPNVPSMT